MPVPGNPRDRVPGPWGRLLGRGGFRAQFGGREKALDIIEQRHRRTRTRLPGPGSCLSPHQLSVTYNQACFLASQFPHVLDGKTQRGPHRMVRIK